MKNIDCQKCLHFAVCIMPLMNRDALPGCRHYLTGEGRERAGKKWIDLDLVIPFAFMVALIVGLAVGLTFFEFFRK